jgi:ABC-type multidrug transport system fused ATPase/permease subunit
LATLSVAIHTQILIDGTELNKLNVRWLRKLIGVVSQEPVLFEASIEDNIKLGKHAITHSQLVAAARSANAHEFIDKLPDVCAGGFGKIFNCL